MIDVENIVFDHVAKAIRAAHSNVYVSGDTVPAEADLPAVSIVEADNRVNTRYRTEEAIERAATLMYEVNVYSNKTAGAKSRAKAITATLDEAFAGLGFTRTTRSQVPNFNNTRIYRIVCRYEGVVIPNDDGNYYIHSR